MKSEKKRDVAGLAGLLSLLGSSAYISKHHHLNDYNPFGHKNISVIGGVKPWDPVARAEATALILDHANGKSVPPEKLDAARRLFMLDSFSAQSQGAADALRSAGFNVKFQQRAFNAPFEERLVNGVKQKVFNPENFYRAVPLSLDDVKGADAILQVGDSPSDYVLKRARKRGSKLYRMLSDYGDGNFNQPEAWLGGQNWMKVRDPKMYDRLFVPGGDAKGLWKNLGKGRQANVNIGLMPVSPLFEGMQFSHAEGAAPKAMLTIGGGTGGSLLLPNQGAEFKNRYNFVGKDRTLFDDILEALRKKHGENATLDAYLGSAIGSPQNILKDGKIVRGYIPSDVKLSKELKKLSDLMNPESVRYKRYMKSEQGRKLIESLKTRYKGLKLISAVPQSDIAKAYATSDYIFTAPGSTTSEFASIKGNKHGGVIHLIPSEAWWAPRHFRGNALYTNLLMQPNAKSNIVSITGKNRAKNILDAVMEGGYKDWGRKAPISAAASIRPMVRAIKRDIMLRRLGRAGKLGALVAPAVASGAYLWNTRKKKSIWDKIKEKLS